MSNDSSEPSAGKASPRPLQVFNIISTSLTGLLLYLMPATVASFFLVLWVSIKGMSTHEATNWVATTPAQFAYVFITETLVVILLAFFLKWTHESLRSIGVRWPKWQHLGYTLAGLAAYFTIFIILATFLSGVLNFDQKQELGFDDHATGINLALIFISLVILPPLVEEILFRGFLYTRFKRALPTKIAAVAVSLLFASAHLQLGSGNPPLWTAALDTFILSMVLVYLRENTGTIWAGVGVHALKNLVAFSILFIHL